MQQYRATGFSMLPEVVKQLIIINGLLFLAKNTLTSTGIHLDDLLGLHYFTSSNFYPHQFISHMFMHANFSHLFFNMFAVWMFGSAIENLWGSKKFLIYYMLTGLGAAALHYAYLHYQIHELSLVSSQLSLLKAERSVMVGASGALFGILMAFGMMFPNRPIYFIFVPFPIKAKYFVLLYGAYELFSGVSNNPGDNIAHFAHLGGMIFGFILIKIWGNNFYRNR